MFPIDAFRETVGKLVAVLRRHGVAFHLTGGVTSIAYGDPRMTQDVGVVVDGAKLSEALSPFLDSLADSDFIHDRRAISTAIADADMFQLLDREETLKLDIYPREMIPGELGRSEQGEIFRGEFLPIASRQDTVLAQTDLDKQRESQKPA